MEKPLVPLPSFLGFRGPVDALTQNQISSSISEFTPTLKQDGIHLFSDIKFSHGIEALSWDILQPLLEKQYRNITGLFLGKTGIEAKKNFNLYEASLGSSEPPTLSSINSKNLQLMIYNLYWNLLKELIPDLRPITGSSVEELGEQVPGQYFDSLISCKICNNLGCDVEINPSCPIISVGNVHLVLLLHVFDVGFRNHRHLNPLIAAAKLGNPSEMLPVLIDMIYELDDLNPDEDNHVWNRRRIREILHLLRRGPFVSTSLGSGASNEAEDLVRVAERLNELGYLADTEFAITGTTQDSQGNSVNEYDFSPLIQFCQIVKQTTQTNHNLLPGSICHLRLLSSNVAKWEELTGNLPGIDFSSLTLTHTTSWINQVLRRISNRYRRIQQAHLGLASSPTKDIVIQSISSNGDEFVIGLPVQDGVSNSCDVSSPSYDRDSMRLMLQAIIEDSQVPNSTFVHLSDPLLAREGLCTLRSHDSNVIVSDTHVSIRLVPPEIELEIEVQEQPPVNDETDLTPVSLNLSPVEQLIDFLGSKYTPDDSDGTFDYYFDTIIEHWDDDSTPPSAFPQDTVMILGIRGWTFHRWRSPIWDSWCDSIVLLWIDDSNQKRVESFFAATRPGKIRGFDNIKGDSHLEPGQYIYKFNKTTNPTSLVPVSNLTIRRDPVKCGYPDHDLPVEVGMFDISIKEGGDNQTKVGRRSRGSQVIFNEPTNGVLPFDQFMQILTDNHAGADFIYTLIEGENLMPHDADSGGDD